MSKDWKAYERAIAEVFTAAYYPAGDGELRRTSAFTQSGGFGKDMVGGDLVALKYGAGNEVYIDKSFPFSVECKNWREENVKHFFTGLYSAESEVFGWVEQAFEDAVKFDKMPLVAFRPYRCKALAVLIARDFAQLNELFGDPARKHYVLKLVQYRQDRAPETNRLVFMLLEDFVEWVDWELYKFRDKRYVRSVFKI